MIAFLRLIIFFYFLNNLVKIKLEKKQVQPTLIGSCLVSVADSQVGHWLRVPGLRRAFLPGPGDLLRHCLAFKLCLHPQQPASCLAPSAALPELWEGVKWFLLRARNSGRCLCCNCGLPWLLERPEGGFKLIAEANPSSGTGILLVTSPRMAHCHWRRTPLAPFSESSAEEVAKKLSALLLLTAPVNSLALSKMGVGREQEE